MSIFSKELVEFVSKEYGDNPAYISKESTKTFKDLEKDVKALAGILSSKQLKTKSLH